MADLLRAKYLRKLAKRNAEAKRIKAHLIRKRGSKCEWPGCKARTNLTFDHRYGRTYALEGLSMLARYRRYAQEEREGRLRLLCGCHNSRDGAIKGNKGFRNDFSLEKINKIKIKKIERVREFLKS